MAKVTRSNADQIEKTDEYIIALTKKIEEAQKKREQLVNETVKKCSKDFAEKIAEDETLARSVQALGKNDRSIAIGYAVDSLRLFVKILQAGGKLDWKKTNELSNLPAEKLLLIYAEEDGSPKGEDKKEEKKVPEGKPAAAARNVKPEKPEAARPAGQQGAGSARPVQEQAAKTSQPVRPIQQAAGNAAMQAQAQKEKEFLSRMNDPDVRRNLNFLYSTIDKLGGSLGNYNATTAPMFNEQEREFIGRVLFILRDRGIVK